MGTPGLRANQRTRKTMRTSASAASQAPNASRAHPAVDQALSDRAGSVGAALPAGSGRCGERMRWGFSGAVPSLWYHPLTRIRSSHNIAASAVANFGFKAALESKRCQCPSIPKFASECAATLSELRNRDTRCNSNKRGQSRRRRNTMLGLMQDWPLLCHRVIDHAAINHPERCVISRSIEGPLHSITYPELRTRALKLAQRLARDGIRQGDRVATLAWNTWRHLEAWYGILGVGAIYHTVNPRLFPEQIVWII